MPYGDVLRFDLAQVIAGRGRYWTTCYWIDGLLIDTGCAHTAHELIHVLGERRVSAIVNTHSHEDHIGANGFLQRRQPDLAIKVHPLALPVLEDPRKFQPLHLYRRLFWGCPQPCQAETLEDGELIEIGHYHYRVINTPGHSADHVCLFEENRGWLFSGDLFVGGTDRALRQGADIWGIINSLQRVGELPVMWLFPGSARVRENPCEEIRLKISYYQELGKRIIEYHNKGWSRTAIARAIFGGPKWIEFVTLGHFSRKWLVSSYLNQPSSNTNEAK
jgi:glyoxylase-like metal-dependent hydrolase (beta-lactamase superfamily II)